MVCGRHRQAGFSPSSPVSCLAVLLLAAPACAGRSLAADPPATPPADLRCEYLRDALGIDVAQPRFQWRASSSRRGARLTVYQVLIAGSPEMLARDVGDKWDSGRVAGDAPLHVPYAGTPLTSRERCYWKVRCWDEKGRESPFSAPATFEMGLLSPGDWQAKWIARGGDDHRAAPLLRTSFTVKGPVRRARAYVAAAGWYELSLNGRKVGNEVLQPHPTYYTNDQPWPLKDRVLYVTHDLAEHLQPGDNAAGVMLGHGWYSAAGAHPGRQPYGDRPKALVQIEIEYADGTRQQVISDKSWKVSAGPVTSNEMCLGESYDARLVSNGWDAPGFDDRSWEAAAEVPAPSERISSQCSPPSRVVETLPAIARSEPSPGVFVFDFGQHMSGWTRVRVAGPAGTTLRLRHAGRVHADSSLDVRNNLAAEQTDAYTLRGDAEEVWEPRFTLHGFRYVELTGYPGKPPLNAVEGRHVRNDVEITGSFRCSNPLIDRIHTAARWTLATSLQGLPQDAAERQERMGWLGDSGFLVDEYLMLFDSASFWTKWLRDIQDAQRPDGNVPVIAPLHLGRLPAMSEQKGWRLAPDWTATYPLIVWSLYWHCGDERVLAEHYDSLCRLAAYYESQANGEILPSVLGDHMEPQADGSPSFLPKHTPQALTTTCYYYRVASILAESARVLGKQDDAERYAALAERIRRAFHREFFDAEKRVYGTGSQTSLASPLAFDMIDEPLRVEIGDRLVEEIVDRHRGHLSTGLIGTSALVRALPRIGRADVMYGIATQTTYPSWGHQLENGATTFSETWEAGPTYSLNMKMFCSIARFLHEGLAGIQPAAAGYRRVVLRPCMVGDLRYASARQVTMQGPIEVRWERSPGAVQVEAVIPVGSIAEVHVPMPDIREGVVTEGDRVVWRKDTPAETAEGVIAARREAGSVVFEVGSGSYRFVAKAAQ